MKKGDILEGVVEELQFPNKGIIHTDNKKIIVKNSVPGQKVRFSVCKVRKDKVETRLLELLEKAPNEMETPYCEHFGVCGGCSYQSLPYEDQLELKESQVKHLLEPVIGTKKLENLPILSSPDQFGYRNKMEFTFGDEVKDGPLTLGMHKRGSFYDIVTVDGCQIMDQDFRTILHATQEFFRKSGIAFYHRMRHDGVLRNLLVRKAVSTKEIMVDIVATSELQYSPYLGDYATFLQGLKLEGKLTGILYTRNDAFADAVIDEGTTLLFGRDYFEEEILGLKFHITPFSFFQTNSRGAEVLYGVVRNFVQIEKPDPVIYDLYSGTGTIAQILSPSAKKVIGVEIVEEAVDAARDNAIKNRLENCEFICGDVLKTLDQIEEMPDYIILDPPRDGIHPKALQKILAYNVPSLIYVSCKPTSLARDLAVMKEAGYEVQKICCVDMFPGTSHVETVCLLSKKA